jgi:hypothetical protein
MAAMDDIFRPTAQLDEPQEEGQEGHREETAEPRSAPKAARRSRLDVKAQDPTVKPRTLYLSTALYHRLRLLAYSKDQSLSDCAAEILEKNLPAA